MAGNILRMAIPMTIAQMVNVLYSVVDRFFIGHIDGASSMALTGVGIVFPIISVITAFTNLFGMGGAPLCSIARGITHSVVQLAQLEASVGKAKTGLFRWPAAHLAVSMARPPPMAKIISASLTSGIASSMAAFS